MIMIIIAIRISINMNNIILSFNFLFFDVFITLLLRCVYICIFINVYIYIYINVCVCVCVSICIYVYFFLMVTCVIPCFTTNVANPQTWYEPIREFCEQFASFCGCQDFREVCFKSVDIKPLQETANQPCMLFNWTKPQTTDPFSITKQTIPQTCKLNGQVEG